MVNIDYVNKKMAEGLNWGQVVVDYFTKDIGISKEFAYKMAALLGSGLNLASTCGAVTGAYLVLGVEFGENTGYTKEKMREFNEEFIKENKYFNCLDLLGYNMTIPKERQMAVDSGIKGHICPKAVASSINILEKII